MIDKSKGPGANLRHALVACAAPAVLVMISVPAFASDPNIRLSSPVGCKIGGICTIQNYVDRDPGPGAKDYTCGRLVYNGHKGTDFRLPDASWLKHIAAVLSP